MVTPRRRCSTWSRRWCRARKYTASSEGNGGSCCRRWSCLKRLSSLVRCRRSSAPRLDACPPARLPARCGHRQAQAIPSYLLALSVGNLESRSIGPISAVWSEPEMVEAGAAEFQVR